MSLVLLERKKNQKQTKTKNHEQTKSKTPSQTKPKGLVNFIDNLCNTES